MLQCSFFMYNFGRKKVVVLFEYWNPSPVGAKVGDCSVRAVAKALGTDWQTAYTMLCLKGFEMCDMPNSNSVINALLVSKGFERYVVPNTCPDCYTVGMFADDNKEGTYVLGTGDHVVTVTDGVINDSWDSSNETPIFFWKKTTKKEV